MCFTAAACSVRDRIFNKTVSMFGSDPWWMNFLILQLHTKCVNSAAPIAAALNVLLKSIKVLRVFECPIKVFV